MGRLWGLLSGSSVCSRMGKSRLADHQSHSLSSVALLVLFHYIHTCERTHTRTHKHSLTHTFPQCSDPLLCIIVQYDLFSRFTIQMRAQGNTPNRVLCFFVLLLFVLFLHRRACMTSLYKPQIQLVHGSHASSATDRKNTQKKRD